MVGSAVEEILKGYRVYSHILPQMAELDRRAIYDEKDTPKELMPSLEAAMVSADNVGLSENPNDDNFHILGFALYAISHPLKTARSAHWLYRHYAV